MKAETLPFQPLPPEVEKRARELLGQTRNHTTYAGTGLLFTDDDEIAAELAKGWVIGEDETGQEVVVACSSRPRFTFAPGGTPYHELNLPPALVEIARSLRKEAA